MLAALSQVAGHLLAVLMWADTPQRAAMVAVSKGGPPRAFEASNDS